MCAENIDNPKQRIFDTSVELFARKGFSAVGVREIARRANVNISMISYYYDNKVGLLKVIIDEFHDKYYHAVKDVIDEEKTPEENVRLVVRRMVDFVRSNIDLSMVAFYALPLDISEITDIKMEKISTLLKSVVGLFGKVNIDVNDPVNLIVVGPALISMILTHFRYRPVQEQVYNVEFDDAFYDRYAETLATLYMRGITGIAGNNLIANGDNHEDNC